MKAFTLIALLGGLLVTSTGCLHTPAYNSSERHAMILRNWDYEGKQAVDDMDSLLLLRPASHMTIWNVR